MLLGIEVVQGHLLSMDNDVDRSEKMISMVRMKMIRSKWTTAEVPDIQLLDVHDPNHGVVERPIVSSLLGVSE
jgi:hypothetical protein